jgi:Cu/Ag efflux protein CusF
MKRVIAAIALSGLAGAGLSAPADATSHASPAVASAAALSEGEIRKVDKDTKKLTIRHGPLENLDMPAMTMVFQVKDAAVLDRVKVGDKVKFTADRIGGAYTVTHLEALK